MNKDVIYIEPEDDITDIITKIEQSTEKITVLVPPKKAGVFRSVVNIKLIAKAAANAEKTVVLVTVDPSIIKLAAASRIPVTKDLKTPPTIPPLDDELADNTETEILGDDEEEVDEDTNYDSKSDNSDSDKSTESSRVALAEEEEEVDLEVEEEPEDENSDEEDDKKAKKDKKSKKSSKNFKEWLKNHKIQVIIGAILAVGVIGFLIWAFVIAPAITVNVEVQTEVKSLSENVTFTTNTAEENAENGVFYLEQKTIENAQEVKFDATGKKNVGETAKGEGTVYATLGGPYPQEVKIPSNQQITIQGMSFTITEGATLSLNEDTPCEGSGASAALNGCKVQGNVKISANAPGEAYNISWNDAPIGISNATLSGSTSGGTNKEITIVEQIDVENAKNQLKNDSEDQIKQKLYDTVDKNNMMIIESSFQMNTTNATATPGVGEEVGEGVTPTLKAVTTASVYIVDKAKIEDFIREKAKIGDDQRVYEINNFYIENFTGVDGKFSGRLKTNYNVGPKMSESEIVDMVKGKGLGDIQHDLKNINGVVSVNIETSFPWVSVAPSDSNKITVNLNVKENGNKGVDSDSANSDNDNTDGENGGNQ